MISVITAVHNGLDMNRLFLDRLKQYTSRKFELVVIDNASTDGSGEFFRKNGASVIRNEHNFSYPYTQNQGIAAAQGEWLAFLNNDIIVAPEWDIKLLRCAQENNLEVLTPCGIERLETRLKTKLYRKKWNLVKRTVSIKGKGYNTYALMHKVMYGNWEKFCRKRWEKHGTSCGEGFVGNSVLMRRTALHKIGLWDERIQAADFDLYIRVKKRALEVRDIMPVHIAWGVFHHHYIRVTLKSNPPAFHDAGKLMSLEEKWGESLQLYLKDNVET